MAESRERDDQVAWSRRRRTTQQDQATIRKVGEGRDRALNLPGIAHVDGARLHPERRCRGLDSAKLSAMGGTRGILDNSRSGHVRCDLLEEFQLLADQTVFVIHKAGSI